MLGEPHQPGWWWCWQTCTGVNKGSGQTLHWQLVFQRCIGCEPGGRWCGRGCQSVPADVGQTAHCLHSGCNRHAHCHSSYIWYCRQHLLGHHPPVVDSIPASETSHSLWRWHFVELMERLEEKGKIQNYTGNVKSSSGTRSNTDLLLMSQLLTNHKTSFVSTLQQLPAFSGCIFHPCHLPNPLNT